LGPAFRDRSRSLHDRGLRRRSQRTHRIGALGDRSRRIHDLYTLRQGGCGSELSLRPEQQYPRTLLGRKRGAGGNLGRTHVRTVAIDRHDRRGHLRLLVVVVVLAVVVGALHHDLPSCVRTAHWTHPMRSPGAVAFRTRVHRRRTDLVLRAALRRAAVRLLFLGYGHRSRSLPALRGTHYAPRAAPTPASARSA